MSDRDWVEWTAADSIEELISDLDVLIASGPPAACLPPLEAARARLLLALAAARTEQQD